MKFIKFIHLIIAFVLLFASQQLIAQVCVTGDVILTTQAEVNTFVATHNGSGCSDITGNLIVSGAGINNLSGLNFLSEIGGTLFIASASISNLNGLQNITTVSDLSLQNMPTLTDISQLSGIVDSGVFQLFNVVNVTDLSSLTISNITDLTIYNTGVTGLGGLQLAGTMNNIWIDFNPNINNISALSTVNEVTIDLLLRVNNALPDVDALQNLTQVGVNIDISGNPLLTTINGLQNVSNIGGNISVTSNNVLASLNGLENVLNIGGDLTLFDNPSLTDISALAGISSLLGNCNIQDNSSLDECCIIQDFVDGTRYLGGTLVISGNDNNCANIPATIAYCNVALADDDNDGVVNTADNCSLVFNSGQEDEDGDGIGNACDNCPNTSNPAQIDTDGDGIGDDCEAAAGNTGSGFGGVGINTVTPHSLLEVTDGDIFINNIHRGVIMKTAGGRCFRYQPDESGVLISKQIDCPDN